ncbi:adult-specific rigid cuticular protein 15.7-like [Tropilaelaps mercedesae]|uniref:Adult-specific rigid cuticular protein 15.7-like n=1 Tax=Tropilaelaps mercedesae TaxID=418985 RepID=A0A1V9WZA9_9ACAR|nr:adult-specific rigid cuticular protein 15.7-like [Tropilaelaps mercedesae]
MFWSVCVADCPVERKEGANNPRRDRAFIVVVAGCVFSLAFAGHYGDHGGHSTNLRHQDDYGNYEFKYDIKDGHGNVNGRQEKGSHGHVLGAYYLGEIDGRHRHHQNQ